jgi:hypothetical protein
MSQLWLQTRLYDHHHKRLYERVIGKIALLDYYLEHFIMASNTVIAQILEKLPSKDKVIIPYLAAVDRVLKHVSSVFSIFCTQSYVRLSNFGWFSLAGFQIHGNL